MQKYLFLLFVIGISVHGADMDTKDKAAAELINPHGKEFALLVLDARLFEFEGKNLGQKTPEYNEYLQIRRTKDDISAEKWHELLVDPLASNLLYLQDYKDKIEVLKEKFMSPETPRRKLSAHIPLDSDPKAAARVKQKLEIKARINELCKKLTADGK